MKEIFSSLVNHQILHHVLPNLFSHFVTCKVGLIHNCQYGENIILLHKWTPLLFLYMICYFIYDMLFYKLCRLFAEPLWIEMPGLSGFIQSYKLNGFLIFWLEANCQSESGWSDRIIYTGRLSSDSVNTRDCQICTQRNY